jgi:ABC-type transporter Mla maintaining outer membrane lipid asymmetry ATPase subunit MlaF
VAQSTGQPGPVIELSGVSKDYHGLRPLRIQALTLAAGEQVAVLGLDGPMAETLVNLVTGAALPNSGDVTVFGRSTAAIGDSTEWLALVDRFGIVSARAVLLEGLSVIQNLSMPFTLEIDPPPDDVRDCAAALAREVGLPEHQWPRPVGELEESGRARIRLARALALEPAVLVLEHASAGLSPEDATTFGSTIRRIASRRGIAILAVTANDAFAKSVAARLLRHEPATGRLTDQRGGFLGRLFSRS